MSDEPRAQTAPVGMTRAHSSSRLTRKTLRRLTKIPAHKLRGESRTVTLSSGGGDMRQKLAALMEPAPQAPKADDDQLVVEEPANERRKKFLTMSNLKRVFRALDLGDDGYIDTEELYEAQKKLGGRLSRHEVEDIIWEVDDDMDGRLSMNDYLTTYRRSQSDEEGFEPRRFFSIVEFLLMDRDCSGEITIDEAMTTLFERQGAHNLGDVTKEFFRAVGAAEGEEPPPGTTISFATYYSKIGCAKPLVPSMVDLRRSFSTKLRIAEGKGEAPKLRPSASVNSLPRILQPLPPHHAPSKARSKSPPRTRPSTVDIGVFSSGARGRGLGSPGSTGSGGTPKKSSLLANMRRTQSGGVAPLQPIQATSGLAASSLSSINYSASKVTVVKEQAAAALGVGRRSSGLRPAFA